MLGLIFRKAQNKIQDPAKLRQLVVELIDKEQWLTLSADLKGDAYEGLLERNAQDVKGGAGQYFTPRSVIGAIIDCIQPAPKEQICDPACGTGGFLLGAHHYLASRYELDRDQKKHLRYEALRGVELVDGVARLCAMNLYLHGIGPDDDDREPPIEGGTDSLRNEPSRHFDVVVTNPPFGKKSSITVVNEEGEADTESVVYNRPDFWTTTTNKQLNFRTNMHFTLKQNRMSRADLDEFVAQHKPGERHKRKATWSEKRPEGRWRPYTLEEITARDKTSLDIFWLKDDSLEDSASLPEPHVLAAEIAEDLEAALEQIREVAADFEARAARSAGNEEP